jgi:MFS family permease
MIMLTRLLLMILGAVIIGASSALMGRANPGRKLATWGSERRDGSVPPAGYFVLSVVGFGVCIFGGAGLVDRWGWWFLPVFFLLVLVCQVLPRVLHNRALDRSKAADQPDSHRE